MKNPDRIYTLGFVATGLITPTLAWKGKSPTTKILSLVLGGAIGLLVGLYVEYKSQEK